MSRPVDEKEFKKLKEAFANLTDTNVRGYVQYLVFETLHMKINITRTRVKILDQDLDVITINQVQVEEKWRRKGFFKTMLQIIEGFAAGEKTCVSVELVRNSVLRDYLVKIGYTKDSSYEGDHCFWYVPQKERDLFSL